MRARLVVICVFALSLSAYAQEPTGNTDCGTQDEIYEIPCQGYFGCTDSYPWVLVNHDHPWGRDWFEERIYSCCGIGGYYWAKIGECGYALLRNDKQKQELIELAKSGPLLIPDCEGSLRPFWSVLASADPQMTDLGKN